MARLESISFTPHIAEVSDAGVLWRPLTASRITDLPQISWKQRVPWREANLWLFERSHDRNIRTVNANGLALYSYAQWLEETQTDWRHFPVRKADRCLVRYRGHLVRARDLGELAPSTVSARMRSVIQFYSWLGAMGLITPEWPMWTDRTVDLPLTGTFPFHRKVSIRTTDLAIPNRTRPGFRLESGVTPVSPTVRDAVLQLAREHCSEELFLKLALGFFTGMRIGSICDLRIGTLQNAVVEPACEDLFRLAIGPGARPPVATKFGVTGQVLIPRAILETLQDYGDSPRRFKREARAEDCHRDLVFLTKYGNPYATRGADKSPSQNVEMHRLRKIAAGHGLDIRRFRFHSTRATFATALADMAIRVGGPINAVALVRDLLLVKDDATALRYIRFVQQQPIKADLANEFTELFLGMARANANS